MKKNIVLLSCFFILISIVLSSKTVYGNDTEIGFSIRMIPSAYQHDINNTFFDLRLHPNQVETVELEIKNTSNEKNTFEINVNQAYTNNQGYIDYSDVNESKKNVYPIDINKIVSYPHEIKLEANSLDKIPIQIKMPEKLFDGQVLAGIKVVKKEKETSNSAIQNRYGYILGLKITETDTDEPRNIELKNVSPSITFGKPTIVAQLMNTSKDAIGHLKYHVIIEKNGTKNIVLKKTYNNNMELAPNSMYNFAIESQNNLPLSAGKYKINLIITDKKENKWTFNKIFSISDSTTKKVNSLTKNTRKPKVNLCLYAIITVFLLLFLFVLLKYLSIANKQKD